MSGAVSDANRAIKDALSVYKIGKSVAGLVSGAGSLGGSLGSGIGGLAALGSQFIQDPAARSAVSLGGQAAGIGAGLAAAAPAAVVGGIGGLLGTAAALVVGGHQAEQYKKAAETQRAISQDIVNYQGVPTNSIEGLLSNYGALMSGAPSALSGYGPGALQALVNASRVGRVPAAGTPGITGYSNYDAAGLTAEENLRRATGNNLAVVPTTAASPYATMPQYQLSGDLAALQNDPNKIALASSGGYPLYNTPESVSTPLGPMTPEVATAMGYRPKDYVDSLKWAATQGDNDVSAMNAAFRTSAPGTPIPQNMAVDPNLWQYISYANTAPATPQPRVFQAPGAGAVSTGGPGPNTTPYQQYSAYQSLLGMGLSDQAAKSLALSVGQQPQPSNQQSSYTGGYAARGGDVDSGKPTGGLDALIAIGNDPSMPGSGADLQDLMTLSPRQRQLLYQDALSLAPSTLSTIGLAYGGTIPRMAMGTPRIGAAHIGMPHFPHMPRLGLPQHLGPPLGLPRMARGGRMPARPRLGMTGLMHGSGLIRGPTPGRADAIAASLPKGGYVVPSDVTSALGQGNTEAGARQIMGMIRSGMGGNNTTPPAYARGGAIPTADIKVSDGETYIHPYHVQHGFGGGDLNRGSDALDDLVRRTRKAQVRAIRRLPKPR